MDENKEDKKDKSINLEWINIMMRLGGYIEIDPNEQTVKDCDVYYYNKNKQ